MGFLSEIKKLLFVKKSVVKSGMEKAKDEALEKFDELSDKTQEWKESAKEKFDDLAESGMDLKDRAQDKLDNLVDAFTSDDDIDTTTPVDNTTVSQAPVIDENLISNPDVHEKSLVEKVGEKTLEKAEDLGNKVLEATEGLGEKFESLSEKVGKKALETKDHLVDKAKDAAQYIDQKLDETMVKAKELDAELNKNDQDGDGFADTPADLSKSTLSGTDDFFEKAKRFADGEPLEDKVKIEKPSDTNVKGPEYSAYGMEDLDGDGNELVDDAIIDEQE